MGVIERQCTGGEEFWEGRIELGEDGPDEGVGGGGVGDEVVEEGGGGGGAETEADGESVYLVGIAGEDAETQGDEGGGHIQGGSRGLRSHASFFPFHLHQPGIDDHTHSFLRSFCRPHAPGSFPYPAGPTPELPLSKQSPS